MRRPSKHSRLQYSKGAIDMELIDLLIGMAILTAPVLVLALCAKIVLDRKAGALRIEPCPVKAAGETTPAQ